MAKTQMKNQALASKLNSLRTDINEASLRQALFNFFNTLQNKIHEALNKYWNDDFMLQGQIDLILAPIFESQKEYHDLLLKHNLKEYHKGEETGTRLVKIARGQISGADKSKKSKIIKSTTIGINNDELFGTSQWSEDKLRNQTFIASEHTMNRVDKDINQILSEGYKEGNGIAKVRDDITKRFSQLKSWESQRIARTEIHNAQNMGIMNSYHNLGVEYTQWDAANDLRVRTSHNRISGEIIPLGGTYSNGLQYPGDRTGPIEEWINCRCGNLPFIMPDDYIAPPGQAQFKEKDLINLTDFTIKTPTEITERHAMLYGTPIKESLMMNKSAAPMEDLSEFGVSKKGLKTIQRFQKRNFGAQREYGIAFDKKTGKILTDEFEGNSKSVYIPKLKRKQYDTIHIHTDNSLNPPSADDFKIYLTNKNEDVAINLSRNETWLMQATTKFTNKRINKICTKVYEIEEKQIIKLKNEYKQLKLNIRKIKDPIKRQKAQKELEEYFANEFIYKHNKECGDNLLKYFSNIKGLKVKRVFNDTTVNFNKIKDLTKLKTIPYKKSRNARYGPQTRTKTINSKIKIKKDPEKVVKINGKKVYGIEESLEAKNAFLKKWGIHKKELSINEFKFVQLYSAEGDGILNGYYRDISKAVTIHKQNLIKSKYSKEWELLKIKYKKDYISFDEALKISDSIFEKGKILDKDLVVVRRQKTPLLKYSKFGIYHSDSLLSTSISKNVKPEVYGDYISYFVIPKGTKIFYIEGITATTGDLEILFGRGKNFKFIKQEDELISHWKLI